MANVQSADHVLFLTLAIGRGIYDQFPATFDAVTVVAAFGFLILAATIRVDDQTATGGNSGAGTGAKRRHTQLCR